MKLLVLFSLIIMINSQMIKYNKTTNDETDYEIDLYQSKSQPFKVTFEAYINIGFQQVPVEISNFESKNLIACNDVCSSGCKNNFYSPYSRIFY